MWGIQLWIYRTWLLRGTTPAQLVEIFRVLERMHYSVMISYVDEKPVEVRWVDHHYDLYEPRTVRIPLGHL